MHWRIAAILGDSTQLRERIDRARSQECHRDISIRIPARRQSHRRLDRRCKSDAKRAKMVSSSRPAIAPDAAHFVGFGAQSNGFEQG
jgi:hypothetical protein